MYVYAVLLQPHSQVTSVHVLTPSSLKLKLFPPLFCRATWRGVGREYELYSSRQHETTQFTTVKQCIKKCMAIRLQNCISWTQTAWRSDVEKNRSSGWDIRITVCIQWSSSS